MSKFPKLLNKLRNSCNIALFCLIVTFVISCSNEYSPKPRGYVRFDLPEKEYQRFDSIFPYSFEYPTYTIIQPYAKQHEEPYWLNIFYPEYQATVHLSYKQLSGNLEQVMEDTYALVYKHTIKADAIVEQPFVNPDDNVYGFLYELDGNTASSLQFYVTDSVQNFVRGSLYFYAPPNRDSLSPLINFIRVDIQYMMETMKWKDLTKKTAK